MRVVIGIGKRERGRDVRAKWIYPTVVGLACVIGMAGCATGPKGPTDQELITGTMNEWRAGLLEKNLDKILAAYSENYSDGEGRTKAQMREFIGGAISQGYLDNAQVDTTSTQIVITGDQAVANPITLSGPMGSITLSLTFKKEGDKWLVVGASGA
jgi:hypothetical protein